MNKRALILGSLLLAAFAINLDTTIVNVALPTLVLRLHASNSQLQWVVDAYNLVFAALLLAAGSLSDRLGRKGMLLAGLTIFGLSSLAGGFASSAGELIAARCLMGLGAAAVFPATLSLISNVFVERKERALAIGLWGATAGMAIALGPIVGGALLERFSWSSIFFAMAPVAAAALALVALTVPASRDPQQRGVDVAGFALSTAAMALLIFTIIEAPNQGWSNTRTLAGFALTAVLGVAFARWELRAQAPLAHAAHQSAGAALTLANTLGATGHATAAQAVREATANAFLRGLSIACLVAGGVAVAGAILAALLLPAQPTAEPGPARDDHDSMHTRSVPL